ncbi:helicase associated domain (HA2) domain-containing protein [Ditylenchus destructor]|nr:helicase associated domain (HA2) domain-containing protein [Ditylenchus destructor]
MLSPGRNSVLSNARTLLLNRHYSSSIAVTSRSNVFAGLHKNDFLRSNVDNSAQAFLCLQQRGLKTKEKTFDAKPSNSSSNDEKASKSANFTDEIGEIRDLNTNFPIEFDKMDQTSFKNWIHKRLRDFLDNGETELKLESLRGVQIGLTHMAANTFKVHAQCYGKEPNRFTLVTKIRDRTGDTARKSTSAHMNDTQSVELLPEQSQLIQNLITNFPIESYQLEEHLVVRSAKKNQRKNAEEGNSEFFSQRVIPPAPRMSLNMEHVRASLPTFRFREEIVEAVRSNNVTLITGGTGCGKTTQVPQFLLEDAYSTNTPVRIICTQPRRLPAIAVSRRVAEERGEMLGATVGYIIRLEQKTSPKTALTYCTSGILLRLLSLDEVGPDITHIILDEVHEREMNTDYLLISLKQALRERKDLKVILMSATMGDNLATFMHYFDNVNVAYTDIPSRLYNVDKFYLPEVLEFTGYKPSWNTSDSVESVDTDLALELIRYLMDSPVDGSILVFLPGYEEIATIRKQIPDYTKDIETKPVVFILHSQVNSQDQQKVFESVPQGSRKVILSTNIAEASLTIDDVVFVIDSGKVKQKSYDHTTGISHLKMCWIAKSNAEQRSGRAGRCRNGYCFRLYDSEDYDRMLDSQLPEMRRDSIHQVCLHAKMFAPEKMSVKAFLQMAPEPPEIEAVEHSLDFLQQLGALRNPKEEFKSTQSEGALTELGRVIAQLPLEPQMARLLLFGVTLRCLAPVITLVAVLSHRDPFILPMAEERYEALAAKDEFGKRDFSDHLTLLRAFYAYDNLQPSQQYQFCRSKFLSPAAMKMIQGIRSQLLVELKRLRLVPLHVQDHHDPEFNLYSDCWPMVQGAIVAGCYPGIGFVKAGSKFRKILTKSEVNASLHPGSIIKRQIYPKCVDSSFHFSKDSVPPKEPVIEYLAYQELEHVSNRFTVRTVTAVPPLTVLLFAGPIHKQLVWTAVEDEKSENGIPKTTNLLLRGLNDEPQYRMEFARWLSFKGTFNVMEGLAGLRFKLMSHFLKMLNTPSSQDYRMNAEYEKLLDCLSKVLTMDHERNNFAACLDLLPPNLVSFKNRLASAIDLNRQSQATDRFSQQRSRWNNDQSNGGNL